MKLRNRIVLLAISLLSLSSCYKDDSSLNYRTVNPIKIELGGMPTQYEVFSLDTLIISPIVYKEGVNDDDIEYSWVISGDLIVPTVIASTMTLKAEIGLIAQTKPYKLLFVVKDRTTGIFVEQVYEVKVRSIFGGGLIVSDYNADEQGDVSLIMARNFNGAVSKGQDTVMRNIYSRIHSKKIDGIITAVRSSFYQKENTLTIATKNSVERVDPLDYSFIDRNGEMFYLDPGVYNISEIYFNKNLKYDLMINDGKLYPREFQRYNKLYTHYLLTSDLSDYKLSKLAKSEWNLGLAFDELGGRFLEIDNYITSLVTLERTINASNKFQSTDLKNFTCITMFPGRSGNYMHSILQDKNTLRKYSYITLAKAMGNKDNGKPYDIIDFDPAICPGIAEAHAFIGTEKQSVIYYATKTKIYSVNYTNIRSLIVTDEYTAMEGEEITDLYAWIDYGANGYVDYTNPNQNARPEDKVATKASQSSMLVIATYNATQREGFVRTMAIAVPNTGRIEQDVKLHGEFGGFDRISHFVYQRQF